MTTLDFHTLVEQDLQTISSFAYQDLLPEEIDIQANKMFLAYIEDFVQFQPKGNRINDTESRLNDIRTLIVRDFPRGTVSNGGVSVAFLPDDYLYLVGIKATVYTECKAVTKLIPGGSYLLKGSSYSIGGTNYNAGSIVHTTVNYTVPVGLFTDLTKREAECRIVSNSEKTSLERHYYGKTKAISPLGVITGNEIQIDYSDFLIEGVKLSYIRKPKIIDFSSPTDEIDLPLNGQYKLAKITVAEIKEVTERKN